MTTDTLKTAIETACARIAPLWPLDAFVAVNPWLGYTELDFATASAEIARASGGRTTIPRADLLAAVDAGHVTEEDIAQAIAETTGAPGTIPDFIAALSEEAGAPVAAPTFAGIAGFDGLVTEDLSAFLAARFDRGQAQWADPLRSEPLYTAWKTLIAADRTAAIAGAGPIHAKAAELAEAAEDEIAATLAVLGLEGDAATAYLTRLLNTLPGWAGWVRHLDWRDGLQGGPGGRLPALLAARAGWDHVLYLAAGDAAKARWDVEKTIYSGDAAAIQPVDLAAQRAFDLAYHRQLFERLETPPSKKDRATVHAAFCIDVRSEPFRRAFEAALPGAETIGFAGFFGLPASIERIGAHGHAHLPVLLAPQITVNEAGASPEETLQIAARKTLLGQVKGAWKAFRGTSVSSFAFVETAGLAFAGALGHSALGKNPEQDHAHGFDWKAAIPEEQRVDVAASILGGMSLGADAAPLVILLGHGSSTVNNPQGSGLDCGACGGQTGEASARIVAALLDDPDVRAGLRAKGVPLPEDTRFIAGLHDTTTDEVTLFGTETLEGDHATLLAEVRDAFLTAGAATRAERAPALASDGDSLLSRARDWAEVRPEWGLAGCAAFIAGPRDLTRNLDLEGRSFLHSYDHDRDESHAVLELIMTAPMVVASWISMAYNSSTVDNATWGAGDKTLHNVVGLGLGLLEGNGGDLKPGLSVQSVHDGRTARHAPVRLTVVIAAPMAAIDGIVTKHEGVRALVENGWISLHAFESGRVWSRTPDGGWHPFREVEELRMSA
ncbi:MAG: putative inorganic carbon transporter subunit DabA [Rubricella sp.]